LLKISAQQKADFQEIEDQRMIRDIAAYLNRLEPDAAPPFTDEETLSTARDSYHRGRQLGLHWKNSLCLFSFLVRATGGQALTEPVVEDALTESGVDPHHALDEILEVFKISDRAEI